VEKRWRPVAHGPRNVAAASAGRKTGLAALAKSFADMQGDTQDAAAIFTAPRGDRQKIATLLL